MATTWTTQNTDHAVQPTDIAGVFALGLSAALPMAAYFATDMLGDAMHITPVIAPPLGLPEWTVAAAMMLTLPMWGVARWLVGQHGVAGRSASRWIVALIAGVILLPFALAFANPFMTSLLS